MGLSGLIDPNLHEWVNLLVRWFHVVAGITWIGQTYLFNWMEKTFEPPLEGARMNTAGELWMVHGGGFYFVQKQRVPETMPRTLHWFKWESALTWISGVLLLLVVYYAGGLLVEPESGVSELRAAQIGLGALVGGWIAYRLVWVSPLGWSEPLGATVSWALIVASAWGLSQFLSPRAAFMHVGAILGTIMTANVWMVILPAQRQLIGASRAGNQPDMTKADRARRASRHNTYISVPLVLVMVSNHFPTATYGHAHAPLVLGVLVLAGWGAAHWMRMTELSPWLRASPRGRLAT